MSDYTTNPSAVSSVIPTQTLDEVAQRCDGAHRDGDGWRAKCPAHNSSNDTTLRLWLRDGTIRVHCFAGCDYPDVLAALDLTRTPPSRQPSQLFDYHDAAGNLVFQVCRQLSPRKFTQRRPDPTQPGAWIWNVKGVTQIPYRLPDVIEAIAHHQPVYIVEGEKDVETLRAHGLVATCNAMGAGGKGKWRDSHTQALAGAVAIVLADNDEEGRKHADYIAAQLGPVARSVTRLALPGLPEKGDVTDWLRTHSIEEFTELAQSAPLLANFNVEVSERPTEAKTLRTRQLSDIAPERVHWLWKPYLPLGRPVSVEGDPGIGKSTFVTKLIAHITTGKAFPNVYDDEPANLDVAPRNVCLLTNEDDPADTIRPRVEINGGDPARVWLIEGWEKPDGERGAVTMQDIVLLTQALKQYSPAIMVFDPIQAYFGKGMDMNASGDTRPVLETVAGICKDYGCTPIFVRHLRKSRGDKSIYAGLGSIDIAAVMRSLLLIGVDPDNADLRIMAQSKTSNAKHAPSMAYSVHSITTTLFTPDGEPVEGIEAPKVMWEGLSKLCADDLVATDPGGEENHGIDAAKEFLEEILKDGPVLSSVINQAVKDSRVGSKRTVDRAKRQLGVKSRRRHDDAIPQPSQLWECYIPPSFSQGVTGGHTYSGNL